MKTKREIVVENRLVSPFSRETCQSQSTTETTLVMSEANARIIIDKMLRETDWVLSGDDGVINVDTEMQNQAGFADYVLKDSSDFPLCIISAVTVAAATLAGPALAEHQLPISANLNCSKAQIFISFL